MFNQGFIRSVVVGYGKEICAGIIIIIVGLWWVGLMTNEESKEQFRSHSGTFVFQQVIHCGAAG